MIKDSIERIKYDLKDRKLTVIAEQINVRPQTLYNWLKNRNDLRTDTLIKLEEYLYSKEA